MEGCARLEGNLLSRFLPYGVTRARRLPYRVAIQPGATPLAFLGEMGVTCCATLGAYGHRSRWSRERRGWRRRFGGVYGFSSVTCRLQWSASRGSGGIPRLPLGVAGTGRAQFHGVDWYGVRDVLLQARVHRGLLRGAGCSSQY